MNPHLSVSAAPVPTPKCRIKCLIKVKPFWKLNCDHKSRAHPIDHARARRPPRHFYRGQTAAYRHVVSIDSTVTQDLLNVHNGCAQAVGTPYLRAVSLTITACNTCNRESEISRAWWTSSVGNFDKKNCPLPPPSASAVRAWRQSVV